MLNSDSGLINDFGLIVCKFHLNFQLISLGCVLQSNDTLWPGSKSFMMWENVASPMLMFLAVAALAGTSGIIVYKLGESYKLHKNNAEKQDV